MSVREPTSRSDEELVVLHQRRGDERALEELVERYLPLARRLARRYAHTSEPLDDLVQVASAAFVAAVKRFDAARGASLEAFAIPTMLGELRRHFRDTGWSVRPPRAVQERLARAQAAIESLTAHLGRSPTIAEIAERIACTVEDVIEALEARYSYRVASLDGPGYAGDDDDGVAWAARVGSDDGGFDNAEAKAVLGRALGALSSRERVIIHLRFQDEMSQSEIGDALGLSQMHVSRLLRRALSRMETVLSKRSAT